MIIHHHPVFLNEIIERLLLPTDQRVLDLTLGEGGHTVEFLNLGKEVWAFDRDETVIDKAKKRLSEHPNFMQCHFLNHNYGEAGDVLGEEQFDFALFDLGISKYHYQESNRGFSFMKDEPLSMALEPNQTLTAATIINDYSEEDLANLFFELGEEKYSRFCAKLVVNYREKKNIETTFELVEIIKEAYRIKKVHTKINPATKVFQALRIKVNAEFEHIEVGIKAVINSLAPGGRVAVITYHSLEDRIVKNLFNEIGKKGETYNKYREDRPPQEYFLFSPKVIKPDFKEIKENPSSRSAKMRVLVRRSND